MIQATPSNQSECGPNLSLIEDLIENEVESHYLTNGELSMQSASYITQKN